MKVIWSDFAIKQLDDIFHYYFDKAGLKIAKSIVKGILTTPDKLLSHPYIGKVEELLSERKAGYRFLIYTN